jgi:hypothetical protein
MWNFKTQQAEEVKDIETCALINRPFHWYKLLMATGEILDCVTNNDIDISKPIGVNRADLMLFRLFAQEVYIYAIIDSKCLE